MTTKPNPTLEIVTAEPPSETKVMRGIERAFEIADKRALKARSQAWGKVGDLLEYLEGDAKKRVMEWAEARYGNNNG